MSTVDWIIPPSLKNNGIHCVFVQVRKLVGYFSSRVPFSLHRVSPLYGVSVVPQWCCKEEVPEHLDGCIWVLLSASRYVPTMVHGMVKVDIHLKLDVGEGMQECRAEKCFRQFG